ncbi:MAG TPA: hypothetical protein VGP72_01605 [Planctomycetota bacterium]|jgi:hypothetical protein
MFRIVLAIAAIGLVCASAGETAAPAPERAKAMRFGPNDVEVRLSDGSVIRGELLSLPSIDLKTSYGMLSFPTNSLLTVECASRMSAVESTAAAAVLKDLDNDDFGVRTAAQRRLEELGPQAVSALKDAHARASAESKARIDAVLKKLDAAGARKVRVKDTVKAEEFEAQGTLQLPAVALKSKLGDLRIKVEDIEMIRWLARGAQKSLDLDPANGLKDWLDTTVDAVAGIPMTVTAAGSVSLFNQEFTASGNPNMGNGNKPYVPGTLIGKLGANGQPFVIGIGKKWMPESSERFFVRIFWPEQMMNGDDMNPTGHFSITIGTGIWSDQLALPQAP